MIFWFSLSYITVNWIFSWLDCIYTIWNLKFHSKYDFLTTSNTTIYTSFLPISVNTADFVNRYLNFSWSLPLPGDSFFFPFSPSSCLRDAFQQVNTSAGGTLWARWPLSVIVLLLTPHPGRSGRSLAPYTCHHRLYCHRSGDWLGARWVLTCQGQLQEPQKILTMANVW